MKWSVVAVVGSRACPHPRTHVCDIECRSLTQLLPHASLRTSDPIAIVAHRTLVRAPLDANVSQVGFYKSEGDDSEAAMLSTKVPMAHVAVPVKSHRSARSVGDGTEQRGISRSGRRDIVGVTIVVCPTSFAHWLPLLLLLCDPLGHSLHVPTHSMSPLTPISPGVRTCGDLQHWHRTRSGACGAFSRAMHA